MFELEQSIADWRRQMLAAGIKAPLPLGELEIHLREEIGRQVKSGLSEQDAFNSAVQNTGQAQMVQNDFKKSRFGGVPMPAGCKVLVAKFEIAFVFSLAILFICHLVLCLWEDGLNLWNVEGHKLAILTALDLVFAFILAKMFCRVTALGISAEGVSVRSTWLMRRHFVRWPDIKLARLVRVLNLRYIWIVTTSGRKFTGIVLSKSQEGEIRREIRRLVPVIFSQLQADEFWETAPVIKLEVETVTLEKR
jgi:hypothetical protein